MKRYIFKIYYLHSELKRLKALEKFSQTNKDDHSYGSKQ